MRDSVDSLLDSAGWAFVNDLIQQRIVAIDQLMDSGVHEQAEYAAMVAEKRGLRAVDDAADAIRVAANRAETALELAVGLTAGDTHE